MASQGGTRYEDRTMVRGGSVAQHNNSHNYSVSDLTDVRGPSHQFLMCAGRQCPNGELVPLQLRVWPWRRQDVPSWTTYGESLSLYSN